MGETSPKFSTAKILKIIEYTPLPNRRPRPHIRFISPGLASILFLSGIICQISASLKMFRRGLLFSFKNESSPASTNFVSRPTTLFSNFVAETGPQKKTHPLL